MTRSASDREPQLDCYKLHYYPMISRAEAIDMQIKTFLNNSEEYVICDDYLLTPAQGWPYTITTY